MAENNIIKYTQEDIDRIYEERCSVGFYRALLKKGIIAEWCFRYPNDSKTADVVCAYCIDEKSHNEEIGKKVCIDKIKNELWKICGQYSLITNEKI